MQKPYISLYGQLAYVILAGLQLLFIPNTLLTLFGLPPTNELWIRVLGMLVLALSFYYYAMARHGNRVVVQSTVQGRLFFCTGLTVLVMMGIASPVLLGFAVVEIGLALWTWRELRQRISLS